MNENEKRARAYLAAIQAGATGDALAAHFHPEIEQNEFPNRLTPNGAKRNLAGLLDGAIRGQSVIAAQSFEVHNVIQDGDKLALEVSWTGTLAIAIGSLGPGDTMTARFGVFLEFRDGRIWRQHNYDCFDPF
ncbi:MAG: nuclear transport factor 2 family protein [Bauldia sp.]|nr:nuclear transport factor 2 family protein [Bauldia sp.]